MKILQTESEKKAFAITSTVFVLLFLLFFFYKIITPVQEEEPYLLGGEIAINFGNSEVGKGDVQPTEPIAMEPEPEVATPIETTAEPVVTQNKVDVPVVKKTEDKPKAKEEPKKEVVKPKPDPKPSQSTTDALASLINGPKTAGEKSEGQGSSTKGGDQGKLDGDIYSNSTYGSGKGNGSGNGTSWGLNGRALANRGQVVPECNEVGTVVVEIRVDKSGKVVSAQHTKGTTNSAKCLTDAAIATAKTFRWKADDNAPNIQVGFIVINFKVGQ
ncbi:energy transducer TonB [Myroides odoratimimus]|uniref:energy transducer TonB n=1 Tax=Myroides odoratimimus TaxID=76832 RepID=UPI00103D871A|nr:energy transducer TonB [Myroides odoratimimus]MCA4807245.1 energy transducer TonB [Myroides odoratimimus]MDM1094927.1 energy transducer TonB [Myroides odoratimimus]MDM1401009.1 energy transducer TonB [Myroides odoratimimus]MDM1411234.1 energy transducer TonB [Myroides odoratimimus]MDM1464202.1 energy transducer TonB [Myroides odoratimimus]